ncbi:MAG: alpha/beta fold hydrolase [Actinomycetota bacterium]
MNAAATVHARDVDLRWDRAGSGPTLVWGHGLTSSRVLEDESALVAWVDVRRRLDVVRYDARGHGESGFSTDLTSYGWADLALDQVALADTVGADRFVSGGASMGAATALHVACAVPARVRGLVLMIPPTAWETREAQVDLYETMASIIESRGVEPLIAAGAQTPQPDPFVDDEERRARRDAAMRAADPARLAGVLRGAGQADFPPRDRVAAIDVPTLVLAWTGDPGHPVSTAEELDTLIADTTCHIASTADAVGAWGGIIADFVAAIP